MLEIANVRNYLLIPFQFKNYSIFVKNTLFSLDLFINLKKCYSTRKNYLNKFLFEQKVYYILLLYYIF